MSFSLYSKLVASLSLQLILILTFANNLTLQPNKSLSFNKNTHEYKTLGTGVTHVLLKNEDQIVFKYSFNCSTKVGVMICSLVTGDDNRIDASFFKYYFDEQTNPSIEFQPELVCLVRFRSDVSHWGNNFFEKGASIESWYTNIRIPYGKSIKIIENLINKEDTKEMYSYVILRRTESLSIKVGEITLLKSARLVLLKNIKVDLKYLEFVDILIIKQAKVLIFMYINYIINIKKLIYYLASLLSTNS